MSGHSEIDSAKVIAFAAIVAGILAGVIGIVIRQAPVAALGGAVAISGALYFLAKAEAEH